MSDSVVDFSNTLNDSEVKNALEEVKALAANILNTREGLSKALFDLSRIDCGPDEKRHVTHWNKDFYPYTKTFDDELRHSLEQATGASAMIKSITNILGDVADTDGKTLKIELDQYGQRLNKAEDGEAQVKLQFGSVKEALGLFLAKLETAFDAANQDQVIKVKMEEAKNGLIYQQKRLHDLDDKIRTLGAQVLAERETGASAAGVAMLTMNPAAILTALGAFTKSDSTEIALKKAMDDRAKCEDIIKAQNAEIRDLLERISDPNINDRVMGLKLANGSMRDASSSLAGVLAKIIVITNIWQTLNSDIQRLSEERAFSI